MKTHNIAIIAGGGILPNQLAAHLSAQGNAPLIIGIIDHAQPDALHADYWVRLGAASIVLEKLKQHQVQELVMIGKVTRPSLRQLNPDAAARKILGKGLMQFLKGDDGLLRSIADYLETEAGIKVKSIQDYIPDLLVKQGVLFGRVAPTASQFTDIDQARQILSTLSPFDIGQALIIEAGLVLGIECLEGTDGLLTRCAPLIREKGQAILVKMAKTTQDKRVDLPTIGKQTVKNALALGYGGIAVEAGRCLISDQQDIKTLLGADAPDKSFFIHGF
ncbi:MAG: LpxI family protein [Alphaproteobacteria bacterium]